MGRRNKMKILLINPPKEKEFALFVLDDYNTKARSNQVPLGLLYLQSYLKGNHDIKILDMNALELPIKAVRDEIDTFKPDIIGITCVIAKWLTVRALSKEIKSFYGIPIVVGGINPSLYPWETLACKDIDYVVSGYGQTPFEGLLRAIKNKHDLYNIPNVYNRDNCIKKIKGSFDFVSIDDFPIPDRSTLEINNYTMPFFPENPATSMITSSGCPHKCSFCACKNFSPVKLRYPVNIINELKHIESLGIRSVLFQDELFTMNKKRIKDICSLIIAEEINLHWSVRSRANLLSLEALELMMFAGCFNIHLGIESGNDRILKCMKKGISLDIIRKSVAMIKEAGLSVTASFMIGYPDETEFEILETIAFARELELDAAQFYITQPEPNTELYNQVKQEKGLPDDIYSDFTLNPERVDLKRNIASNIFSRKELTDFLKLAYSKTNNLYKINGNNI